MQILLDEVQKFETWNGLKVNRDKTCALIAGGRGDMTTQREGISCSGSDIRILECTEACRYLGLWSTANGDMSAMKERVRAKAQEAIDLMKHHPLTPKKKNGNCSVHQNWGRNVSILSSFGAVDVG
jgi:hypothetical protein